MRSLRCACQNRVLCKALKTQGHTFCHLHTSEDVILKSEYRQLGVVLKRDALFLIDIVGVGAYLPIVAVSSIFALSGCFALSCSCLGQKTQAIWTNIRKIRRWRVNSCLLISFGKSSHHHYHFRYNPVGGSFMLHSATVSTQHFGLHAFPRTRGMI